MDEQVILSFLDTDMYKLTMHAAVYTNFPNAFVTYKYINRTPELHFNADAIDWLKKQISFLSNIRFTEDEIEYLRKVIPYLPENYFKYISNGEFCLKPNEQLAFSALPTDVDGMFNLEIVVKGLWSETILYEIPLLALISEAYFKFVDTDWSMDGQVQQAYEKAKMLFDNNISFTEFGTRRRRSLEVHNFVIEGILKAAHENTNATSLLLGTSNVYFARKYGIPPTGTVAHEWIMGVASATDDYINANKNSMDYWVKTFGWDDAGLALTDTFGTDQFLKSFLPPYSDAYAGVRQDSGDPITFTRKISDHYHNKLKYPSFSKTICYSDSLNPTKVLEYAKVAKQYGMKCSFGIGTNFTNDFYRHSNPNEKSEPLNIVIKLQEVNGNDAVKISDNIGKNIGDPDKVREVKKQLGYVETKWEGGNEAHRWA
ncbi:HHL042Wp [Eremothecium sinecaudum]|uniref:Nicotinate phosphoribosyltransferase n=1 Tax=Eremothecium sinecaudum TaxID=45286 RepID=A0A109V110_9SACH|nr:HHL042Wp [Eremothecium sinecaudum]AMD22728.1 HHL042Wp [Eremothecium sinecaudum]